MPRQSDLRFTFTPLIGKATFDVVSFTLEEALSTPFKLHLQLSSLDDDVNFSQLLDQPVLFTVWHGLKPVRYVHGLVSTFSQGDSGHSRTRYQALVEPMLARAGLRSNWRIFQQKTVPQILELILKSRRMTDVELISCFDHQAREFCVQAGETDLDFLSRLAAEEGYVYHFEHSAKGHRLILTDRLLALGTIARSTIKTENDDGFEDQAAAPDYKVLYHPDSGGDQAQPCLRRFRYSEQVRTVRQVQRDYTFTNPGYRQEHAAVASDVRHHSEDYERFDYPGRYKRDAVGKPFTENRLAALRHDARIAEVEGDDVRLQPGLGFDLTEHPREDLNVHWRVMSVRHEGVQYTSLEAESAGAEQGTRYVQHAVLIPGLLEWKPTPLPKPRVDGPHMATVVGPPGEQIYCDEWGRVKVSFPWDRASQSNEFSSCWVRVSQGWAGGTWGSMAIPRVGQEVIIQYVNADPDQPLITGRTYSGTQLPPYELPRHKTRMTIKSQTHKGEGFNELRFEDELGQEEVFIHAQRDQNNHVRHDETTDVGHDRSEQVGNDEKLSIGHDQTVQIGNNAELTIGSNHEVKVGTDLRSKVGNQRVDIVGADHQSETGGNSDHLVKGRHKLTAGQGIGRATTMYELQASEQVVIKGPGGSITIDATGIHLKGILITQEGPVMTIAEGESQKLELALSPKAGNSCGGKL
jgi:type VI secretion system secreted protein VgrG